MSPADFQIRAAQERNGNGHLSPGRFSSKASQPSMALTPHGPSSLRHASTPGFPSVNGTPGSKASFSVVIESPAKGIFKAVSESPLKRIKKRGRPFKTPEAAAAAAARASSDLPPKKRGRPSQQDAGPGTLDPIQLREPKFVPFICEWKGCPAELHNLDTLHAHLVTVHLKQQAAVRPLVCLWRKCYEEHEVSIEAGVSKKSLKSTEFQTKDEWRNHIQVVHLDHIARWQGEGPKTEFTFFEKPLPAIPYTFDLGGPEGLVTPSVRHQAIEDGRAKDNNKARFQKKRDGLYVVLEPIQNPELYMNGFHKNGQQNHYMDEP